MNSIKWISLLILSAVLNNLSAETDLAAAASTNCLSAADKMKSSTKELLIKYDRNHNGKIDVQERKGYVRERSHLIQEYTREEATQRTNSATTRTNGFGGRSFSRRSNQEFLNKYDLDKDGRLNTNEIKSFRQDRRKELERRQKLPSVSPSIVSPQTSPSNASDKTEPQK